MNTRSPFFPSQRAKALDNLAYEMNFDFRRKDNYDFFRLLKEFELYKTSRLKKARNIISKTDPWKEEEIFIFDYIAPKFFACHFFNSRVNRQTVFFASSKYLELPELIIKPKNQVKQWEFLNPRVIRFEHQPEFDKKYFVKGENEVFIKKMVNRFLIHYLTHMDGWTIESLNFLLVIYKRGHLVPPKEMQEFLDSCMEIYHRFKVPLR